MWREIKTSGKAIEMLGGPAAVAALFARVRPDTVSMWGARKRFPPKTWMVLGPKLLRRGCRFDPNQLFDMLEPKRGGRDGATR